jgi:hypothetical protein
MSKEYSVRAAGDDGVTFWIVPVSKLTSVLRQTPETAVAVCIIDEFTVDTPRERYRTARSPVVKHMITQATPQALEEATRGMRSWLKELLGGTLHAPSCIHRLVRERSMSEAQLAAEQLCKLDLLTVTAFRAPVRADLAALVPPQLDVYFGKSRRATLTSYLQNSDADLVPANFANVLLSMLQNARVSAAASERLVTHLQSSSANDLASLAALVRALAPTEAGRDHERAVVERVATKITEFEEGCVVCYEESPPDRIRICGQCGCCTCAGCFGRMARCPWCRAEKPALIARPDALVRRVASPVLGEEARTLAEALAQGLCATHDQFTNLRTAMHALVRFGFRRTLLLLSTSHGAMLQHVEPMLARISTVVGFGVLRVDARLTGKGTAFARAMEAFESPDPAPLAMVCLGMQTTLLTGTDLTHADSLVTVGSIPNHVLTQALGRTFRPRASRDNRKPIAMVKICS